MWLDIQWHISIVLEISTFQKNFLNIFLINFKEKRMIQYYLIILNKSKLKFIHSSKVKPDLPGSRFWGQELKKFSHKHLIFNLIKLKCIELIKIYLMNRYCKVLIDYGHKKVTIKKLCSRYGKFKNPKILCMLYKNLD